MGIVTGGGSGHKPAFIGYLGRNMVDAVAVGEIFTSPAAKPFYDAFRAADGGAGVACLYGNYAGDNMNVKMADAWPRTSGHRGEDRHRQRRRGLGAQRRAREAARRGGRSPDVEGRRREGRLGGYLDEVIAAAQKAIDNTRSIGIGLTPCTIPAVGQPNFTIEPGRWKWASATTASRASRCSRLEAGHEMAAMMVDVDPAGPALRRAATRSWCWSRAWARRRSWSSTSSTTRWQSIAAEAGIPVHRPYVGNYFTSLEMMGVTLTLMKLDDELKALLDLDADCVGLHPVLRACSPCRLLRGQRGPASSSSADRRPSRSNAAT